MFREGQWQLQSNSYDCRRQVGGEGKVEVYDDGREKRELDSEEKCRRRREGKGELGVRVMRFEDDATSSIPNSFTMFSMIS